MAADDGIDIGDVVRLCRMVRGEDGDPTDPATATLTLRKPSGETVDAGDVSTIDAGVMAACSTILGEAISVGTGLLSTVVTPDETGTWRYRWYTEGPQAAEEGSFQVRRRRVSEPTP